MNTYQVKIKIWILWILFFINGIAAAQYTVPVSPFSPLSPSLPSWPSTPGIPILPTLPLGPTVPGLPGGPRGPGKLQLSWDEWMVKLRPFLDEYIVTENRDSRQTASGNWCMMQLCLQTEQMGPDLCSGEFPWISCIHI